MIVFGAISSKTIRAPYNIEVDGYKVSGYATYNKDNSSDKTTHNRKSSIAICVNVIRFLFTFSFQKI